MRAFLGTPNRQRAILAVGVVVLGSLPTIVAAPPIGLEEGVPAPRTYRASRTIQFNDEAATAELRSHAAEQVTRVTTFDPGAASRARAAVSLFFSTVDEVRRGRAVDTTAAVRVLASQQTLVRDESALRTAIRMAEADLDETARVADEMVVTMMSGALTEERLPDARISIVNGTTLLPLTAGQRYLAGAVGSAALQPTLIEDRVATSNARRAAAAAVEPVIIVKQAGENVVEKGDVVTAQHIGIISSLGFLEREGDPAALASVVLLMAGVVLASGAYLQHYEKRVFSRTRDLVIIAVLYVGMVWVTRAIMWVFPATSPFILPAPLAPILGSLLVNPTVGLLLVVLTSVTGVFMGYASGLEAVAAMVTSLTGVLVMARLTQRRHLVYAGIVLVFAQGFSGALATLAASAPWDSVALALGNGALGGLLSVVLAYGLLPFLEHVFGVTTDIRLLELSSPAHPLLRELMTKAPGTYSHSVMTANLAETAAEAIGANALLARVGGYYHDVGKTRRPTFFAENQGTEQNPHDETSPSLSALIITAHVREGIELAERGKLPPEVIAIIREHHGDSLVSYFYNKAHGGTQPVYEADFRYTGERPHTREAALVMLADTAEAAVRAVGKPSLARIEGVIRKVFQQKIADHQLDEADITLAELERVIGVYSRLLASLYHPRVEYPESPIRRTSSAR